LPQLRRFTLAVLAAAETAADFAGILYTDARGRWREQRRRAIRTDRLETASRGDAGRVADEPTRSPAALHVVRRVQARNPERNRPLLEHAVQRRGGNSVGLRLRLRYASIIRRTTRRSASIRSHLELAVVLDRILAAWFERSRARFPSLCPRASDRSPTGPISGSGTADEHVDPSKEATAQGTRLANHTTTLADEYARQQASDWETRVPPAQKRSP
jgi:hypothetical protein